MGEMTINVSTFNLMVNTINIKNQCSTIALETHNYQKANILLSLLFIP